jgi:5-methylcytosine-specific restriction endonuclease McrA
MPIDYKKYPPNWKELRDAVLKRAENKCEFCGVSNYAVGFRNQLGEFFELPFDTGNEVYINNNKVNVIKIILTIAHLDHDEENHNVKIDRLKALCQRCHLQYDIKNKQHRRFNKKAIGDLFE